MYISVDPYMRGRMSDAKSYVEPYEVGKPIMGEVVAEVVESKNDKLQKGAVVVGNLPWQQYVVHHSKGLNKIDLDVAPLSYSRYARPHSLFRASAQRAAKRGRNSSGFRCRRSRGHCCGADR